MATRDYEGPGITVHWDGARCVHSERCTTGLPAAFDKSARPWVDVYAAPADEIAAVIDRCPSGALTYTRTDGSEHGRRGYAVDEDPSSARAADAPAQNGTAVSLRGGATATIAPELDGPYVVMGPLALLQADGTTRVLVRATLCRCGQSSAKPFCDGTHQVIGFRAPGVEHPYA